MFTVDEFIQNQAEPLVGKAGLEMIDPKKMRGGWDPGLRRPYLAENGRSYVDVTIGYDERKDDKGQVVCNAAGEPYFDRVTEPQRVSDRIRHGLPVLQVDNATTLTKDAWIRIDAVVAKAVRQRLRAYADLRAANTLGGFDGMSTPLLEYEAMTDPGEALFSMEGLAEGRNFAPKFDRVGLPLPIAHSDFHMAERFLAASRASGKPQDMLRVEIAARRVAELIEQVTIGNVTGPTYGVATDYLRASKVFGYTNFPARITKTDLTAPTSSNGTTIVSDVLAMIQEAYDENFYGPFILYTSTGYDAVLDNDLKAESDKTVRQRIREIDQITDVRRLDYLSGDVLLLVQMTADVCEAVNGSEITTVQWDTKGGMQRNFKVMGIQVPRLRSTFKSGTETQVTGIVHGTTS